MMALDASTVSGAAVQYVLTYPNSTYPGAGLVQNATGDMVVQIGRFAGPFEGAETVLGGAGSVTVSGYYGKTQVVLPAPYDGSTYSEDKLLYQQDVLPASDLLVGGSAGNNLIIARSFGTTIFGGGNGDVLEGWGDPQGGDTIIAGPGAETVFGNGSGFNQPLDNGNLTTGRENFSLPPDGNLLVGGSGPDLIVGGPGRDTIVAGTGADTIATGVGGSLVQLGAGGDVVNLSGADTVLGSPGNATISATGSALMFAGPGATNFLNGAAASTLVGGGGGTTLYAGAGGGVFVGGAGGGNLLVGGSGLSLMYGGAGAGNVFQFNSGTGGADVIGDFDPSRDRVALAGFAPGTADAVLATATVANGSVSIVLPDATQVTFYHLAALTGADFGAG